jgi:protein SHQ1
VKISSAEVIAEGKNFSFYCKPYLLKLSFHNEFSDEEGGSKAVYDPNASNGILTVEVKKKNFEEVFEDLDMITKLMKVRPVTELNRPPGIDVLHSENFTDFTDQDEEQLLSSGQQILNCCYGFNNQYHFVFNNLSEFTYEIFENYNVYHLSSVERRSARIQTENATFDPYRYLGDFVSGEEDTLYHPFLNYNPFWATLWEQSRGGKEVVNVEYSEEERDIMTNKLKNKEFLIENPNKLLLCLVDILFAYCYEIRLTNGETTVESSCNIIKLSGCFSWLDSYDCCGDTIDTVLRLSMRRLVSYPYLRHWKLGRKVLADIAKILFLGKRCLLKCYLHLYHLIEHTESYYLLNTIFVHDYCVWLQDVSEITIRTFAKVYNTAKNQFEQSKNQGKDSMGFYLSELEELTNINNTVNLDNMPEDIGMIPPHLLQYDLLQNNSNTNSLFSYLKNHEPQKESDLDTTDVTVTGLSATIEQQLSISRVAKPFTKPLIEEIASSIDQSVENSQVEAI